MSQEQLVEWINDNLEGVVPKAVWGETSFFYNPGQAMAHGVYFCTIKEQDGVNDQSSDLDRPGIYRVAIGLRPNSYAGLFGEKPKRPAKGHIVDTGHDFALVDELMPHPVYAWMNWVQILNPSVEKFAEIKSLVAEAHRLATKKFAKRTKE
ncbi:MAG: DUF6194 family protein [Planctomycetota bacterium]